MAIERSPPVSDKPLFIGKKPGRPRLPLHLPAHSARLALPHTACMPCGHLERQQLCHAEHICRYPKLATKLALCCQRVSWLQPLQHGTRQSRGAWNPYEFTGHGEGFVRPSGTSVCSSTQAVFTWSWVIPFAPLRFALVQLEYGEYE